ncbi:hypothetical protein LTR37_009121 [Vermiconidia calcicola]|uniref:Uncharacterized protein n=1 Tax=Vermiconidia calcicola TaxID=1690605 RepID=A0ACC3NAE0_9PEZI|nr:hypothetical protein LTR37_009121 [Vermiconidia calcicola]
MIHLARHLKSLKLQPDHVSKACCARDSSPLGQSPTGGPQRNVGQRCKRQAGHGRQGGFNRLSQEVGGPLAFDADGERATFHALPSACDSPRTPTTKVRPAAKSSSSSVCAMLVCQPLADGQETIDFPHKSNDVSTIFNASATGFYDATVEVERQECISDFAFNELFNYQAFVAPVIEGDDADAESALRGFPSSYELDLERSGGFHI